MNDDLLYRLLRDSHTFGALVRSLLEERYLREAVGREVTFTQLSVLRMVAGAGRHHIGDVAHFLDASYPAASKLVDRMKLRKLLKGTPFPGDRRAETLEVTPKGRSVIERYDRLKIARVRETLQGVPPAELESVCTGIETLITHLLTGKDLAERACLRCDAYYTTACMIHEKGVECPYRKGRVATKISKRLLNV